MNEVWISLYKRSYLTGPEFHSPACCPLLSICLFDFSVVVNNRSIITTILLGIKVGQITYELYILFGRCKISDSFFSLFDYYPFPFFLLPGHTLVFSQTSSA